MAPGHASGSDVPEWRAQDVALPGKGAMLQGGSGEGGDAPGSTPVNTAAAEEARVKLVRGVWRSVGQAHYQLGKVCIG